MFNKLFISIYDQKISLIIECCYQKYLNSFDKIDINVIFIFNRWKIQCEKSCHIFLNNFMSAYFIYTIYYPHLGDTIVTK